MKKLLIIFTLLTLTLTDIFALQVGSKIDTGLYYYPSINLEESSTTTVSTSIASTFDIELLYFKLKKDEVGPYISLLNVSRSTVSNNTYLRKFSGTALGFDWGHYFSKRYKLNTKLGVGIGSVGESSNKEMYFDLSLIPSIILDNKKNYDVNLNFIFNGIYRKNLFSPSVGIGIGINLDWPKNTNEKKLPSLEKNQLKETL